MIAVVRKIAGQALLVKVKQFKLGTEYGTVLGWLSLANQKHDRVVRILIDQTGVGEVFVEEAAKAGLKNSEGVMLSLPQKQQIMVYLKKQMQEGKAAVFYDQDLINQLNLERYELTKTGQMQFSHPAGTHDDQLWAFALAVYASRPENKPIDYTVYLSKRPGEFDNGPKKPWDNDNTKHGKVLCTWCGRWNPPNTDCICGHKKADGTYVQ
ncbi:MAG TPA: hypothetical protein VFE98_03020 [Candidatus Bathyarchaeia archaeon]|nr:hypothetical protein [Candidatus Bathyarchaeia archaeon]